MAMSIPHHPPEPIYYVDTSAAIKLLVDERHSSQLVELYEGTCGHAPWVSSDLLRLELVRAIRRVAPSMLLEAVDSLQRFGFVNMDPDIVDAAMREPTPSLRSLDALHVATARILGDQVEAFVTYDDRQAGAAADAGLRVVSPGLTNRRGH